MHTFLKICSKILILLLVLGLLALGLIKYFVFGVHTNIKADIGLKKTNAVWMAHEWVQIKSPNEKVHTLLSEMISNDISLIFLHTGPIGDDGIIPESRYPEAKRFLEMSKSFAPDMKFHAWIGQVRNELHIENPEIRQNIIKDSIHLIKDIGFDGIHLNIEPMQSDPDFALLIWELRREFEAEGVPAELSAAISPIVPELPIKALKLISKDSFLGHDLSLNYSSLKYTKEIAGNLDYVVMMSYDTSFKDLKLYKWFMEQELIFLLKVAPGKALMGIPSYEDVRNNFDSNIENVSTAIDGVKIGLQNIRTNPDDLIGLAIYARWTTDKSEWKTWREKWLGVVSR
ncbi:MAG: glycosyl hydrolase family 18 protein [Candidatus Peregrinibacteria bacterium]|nr:glycosyl hydrolase family 18 protein [Candidatus Peregrinibacteria bacterium]